MKKIWTKPELTVLLRTRPEEAVLAACKTYGKDGSGLKKCNQGPDTGKDVNCVDNGAS